jgi:UDP-3-O-[3-hydroxymyristoyl] glucosamine N-acyltransferase
MKKCFNLKQITDKVLNINLEKDVTIDGLNFCNRETTRTAILSFATNVNYYDNIVNNQSLCALIVSPKDLKEYKERLEGRNIIFIADENPEWVFFDIHDFLAKNTDFYNIYDFPKKIGANCNIHSTAIIEDGVIIGENVVIDAHSVICKGSIISSGTIIGKNTTIASEGFQIIKKGNSNRHINHYGGVYIGENVYVGDSSCICKSLFEGNTFIGNNVKIDSLVQINHNNYVGCNAVITAGVKLCGSTVIEDGVWVGTNSTVLNRVIIGKNAKIGIGSVVTRNIEPGRLAYGVPAKMK